MAYRRAVLPDVGEIFLYKRRGARNIRLSVSPTGKIRVSLPAWAPYSAGLAFAVNRREWLTRQLESNQPSLLRDGQRIGKAHRLIFKDSKGKTSAAVTVGEIKIKSTLPDQAAEVQEHAKRASERALRQEAENLLPQRARQLAQTHGFNYKQVKIKKLTARWGSCSHDGVITLSYFLIQLPWDLIDYVIVHELAHSKQHNHQKEFWSLVESAIPDTKQRREEIRQYRPKLLATPVA
jgi:predicted metal-dependent hydrolase